MFPGSLAALPPQILAENLLVKRVGLELLRARLALKRRSLTFYCASKRMTLEAVYFGVRLPKF